MFVIGSAIAAVILGPSIAGRALVVSDAPQRADAIVVIGGDHKPERMQRAVELYREGFAPLIILSAGTIVQEGDQQIPEARVLRRIGRDLGLPDEAMLLEEASQTTTGNAIESGRICQQRGIHSVLLVTSAYHSRRAARIFRNQLPATVSLSIQPALGPHILPPVLWSSPDQLSVVASEYWKLLVNLLFGK